jgi:vacuolar-type H+-ATPase subunit H
MESVINKIIDIDRQASDRLNEAKKKKDSIIEGTAAECDEIKKQLLNSAEKRIAEIEQINKSEFDMLAAEIESKYKQKQEEMYDFFEKNHTSIEESIFAEIVGE